MLDAFMSRNGKRMRLLTDPKLKTSKELHKFVRLPKESSIYPRIAKP